MSGPVEARILVVDDETPITELVGMALRYEGSPSPRRLPVGRR